MCCGYGLAPAAGAAASTQGLGLGYCAGGLAAPEAAFAMVGGSWVHGLSIGLLRRRWRGQQSCGLLLELIRSDGAV